MLRIALLAGFALAFSAGSARALVPETTGFQGLLTDATGAALPDGTYQLTVVIYDAATAGTQLWQEALSNVPTENGLFTVTLGQITPLALPFDQPYWLGLTVGTGDEMTPRTPLSATPYSLTARTVPDNSLTGVKLADGSVVRGLNGVTDDITLQGSGGVTVSQVGNTLFINGSTGGGGDSDWFVNGNDMYALPTGSIGIGTTTPTGDLHIDDSGGTSTLTIEASAPAGSFNFSQIKLDHPDGDAVLFHQTTASTDLTGLSGEDLQITAGAQLRLNGDDEVALQTNDGSGDVTHTRLTSAGDLQMLTPTGQPTIVLDAREGASSTQGGQITMTNDSGSTTIELDGDLGSMNAGSVRVFSSAGQATVDLIGEEPGGTGPQGGQINVANDAGLATVEVDGDFGSTNGGNIRLFDSSGAVNVELKAADAGGLGRVIADIVEIKGGADLSESFDVTGRATPGTVVCIDPAQPGHLVPSTTAYDRRVAGVVSGAGGVRPGMLMGQRGSVADGEYPVALTGRVYVRADAAHGAIVPGDLLTTSPTTGHAMRVTEFNRAGGATLGKAMTALDEGQGLVLVLVALQ